jgi:predicted small secreted protein
MVNLPAISEGATGPRVKWAQYNLARQTLSYNQVDGIFGPVTKGPARAGIVTRRRIPLIAILILVASVLCACSNSVSGSAGEGGGGGGATGQIAVVAKFIGTTSPCAGVDVNISGPNGYSDEEHTGDDGTVVIENLAPGTYEVAGGDGQAANPVVSGTGVAAATVAVTAGSNGVVEFGCS